MKLKNLGWIPIGLLAACSNGGDPLDQRVDDLVAQMTLEEKVAQMSGDSGILLPEGELF